MRKNTILGYVVGILGFIAVMVCLVASCCSCEASYGGSELDVQAASSAADRLQENQPTPTDIEYSLERYNLIRRTYWVNGMREKALSLPCPISKPLGYVVLLNGAAVVGTFAVDGKVTSLNSYLTPDSEYYEYSAGEYSCKNNWLADVDGSYGENDSGIFFFTPDGNYYEWSGEYLYSDRPFIIESPVVSVAPAE